MKRVLFAVAAAALLATGLPASAAADAEAAPSQSPHRPVVFVHGSAGSALQFATQAKRLASNGYPAEIIEAHEYDSTFATETTAQIFARLDERIARLLDETGAGQVDLLGHSLGTFLSHSYLASPARAATVAHYVNLDGRTASAPPGGVPTLAVWGEGDPSRTIVGATNVAFPDQAHTQVVTSPETFVEIFRFFTGTPPRTTQIVPQPPGQVRLSGRATLFPSNVGVTDARLEIYEVSPLTGARSHRRPVAVYDLAGDGSFGPFQASGFSRYEFAIVRDGAATHHVYYQPFRRTDRLIRLQTSLPGQGLAALMDTSDRHTNLVVSRNKEWWGDQGEGSDRLYLNGQNVLNAAIAPRTKRVIGMFLFDSGADAVTDLSAPIPVFFSQPFISAADVYLPAAPGNFGVVFVAVRSRTGGLDFVNVPNWPSTDHRSTIQINDFL